MISPQKHEAAQGWGFSRYVQRWEKGPGDLNVFTAVIEMMALESKLYRKRSESGRENSVFQEVEGKITL